MTENQSATVTIPTVVIKKVSYIDEDKNTSLHYAAANGNIEDVKKELEKGHDVDPVNYLGWTPLMMATRNGHFKVVELLLEKRADSSRKNNFGYNILLMAIGSRNMDLLKIILQHLLCGGISRSSMQSLFSPVAFAVLVKDIRMVQYLISKQFCVNVASTVGITPLKFANALGCTDIVNLLISNGAQMEKDNTEKGKANVRQAKPVLPHPLILVGQPRLSPQMPFMHFVPNMQMPRKCSDLASPYFTPNVSPLPSVFPEQVFFPQNFSPNQFVSPVSPVPVFSNEFLNMRVMHTTPYYSPVPVNVAYNPHC